jgi:hypothetical protein
MNPRLIKPGMSQSAEKREQPPVPIIVTIRSWVSEFQRERANMARLDLERINNVGKT